ncbi:hypothetical protein BV25DRAFT_1555795 [Artomyces pyxidatus]|uniref:Uncharacterized protein n=1 Tax=Artomyces pyxidatus TaxID=48021 RepID=A0ACB8SKK5_9AGAM|nr:hypothetical protein BV25DRAFT_1555795 [Artomyces pyxidatus]
MIRWPGAVLVIALQGLSADRVSSIFGASEATKATKDLPRIRCSWIQYADISAPKFCSLDIFAASGLWMRKLISYIEPYTVYYEKKV